LPTSAFAAREAFEPISTVARELGASFCATIEGETVGRSLGGFADEGGSGAGRATHRQRLFDHQDDDRAHRVVARRSRRARFRRPVARYWPEFAANGKADITGRS